VLKEIYWWYGGSLVACPCCFSPDCASNAITNTLSMRCCKEMPFSCYSKVFLVHYVVWMGKGEGKGKGKGKVEGRELKKVGCTDGHTETQVILYSDQCYALHWTDKNGLAYKNSKPNKAPKPTVFSFKTVLCNLGLLIHLFSNYYECNNIELLWVTGGFAGSVFISYNHGSRLTVFKVRDRLRAAGFIVWIDEDEMCTWSRQIQYCYHFH